MTAATGPNAHPLRDAGMFVRRFLDDYRRTPVNLLVLVLVPVVFVVVAARPMADVAKLLGGVGASVETATAGWAAGFLAAIAMYFQTRAGRAADRRVVLAGLPAPGWPPPGSAPDSCWRPWPRRRHLARWRPVRGSTTRAASWRARPCSR